MPAAGGARGAELQVFLNGEWVPESQARVSVFDHGLLYGDGVFEGIRAYNGRVFRLADHMERLYDSAKAIALEVPYARERFGELILEALRKNNLRDAYIRPIVARGTGDLGLDPRKCNAPTVIIITKPIITLYSKERYEKGLSVVTVSTRRNAPECLSPNIKSLNYLNNILGRLEANTRGADEGLMLDIHGFVSEATADNIFIVRKGVVLTPPPYNTLKGITRLTAIEVARQEGYEVREEPITLFDVYSADEVFITGTAAEIAPVVGVDGRRIGDGVPGEVTRHLMRAFRIAVQTTGTPIFPEEAVEGLRVAK